MENIRRRERSGDMAFLPNFSNCYFAYFIDELGVVCFDDIKIFLYASLDPLDAFCCLDRQPFKRLTS
jgi:hypothetical protein